MPQLTLTIKHMNAKKLAQYYHKNGVKKTATYFGVTAKTIYKDLKLYDIETQKQQQDREWYSKLPVTPEEYHKKWAHVKHRNWWGCGDYVRNVSLKCNM